MTLRHGFAILIGLGLAMGVFMVLSLSLVAARGADFLSPTAMGVLGLGCLLVVARPSWAIAKRIVPDTPADRD